jgi:hypothetical protein
LNTVLWTRCWNDMFKGSPVCSMGNPRGVLVISRLLGRKGELRTNGIFLLSAIMSARGFTLSKTMRAGLSSSARASSARYFFSPLLGSNPRRTTAWCAFQRDRWVASRYISSSQSAGECLGSVSPSEANRTPLPSPIFSMSALQDSSVANHRSSVPRRASSAAITHRGLKTPAPALLTNSSGLRLSPITHTSIAGAGLPNSQ